ncbi:hypothetical protein I5907_00795 [Panacibacter sp. DH6]|uniref:Uncharacterized protein n=1 Tax=Panacibacter microcysteis TaxID=2793269 RepID=A0A931GY65_9BACT|nr:hypothetical protein [Panacibacter microcysteis]MBG9374757.1 hypothetical protein [Panacibacter microcysteis]
MSLVASHPCTALHDATNGGTTTHHITALLWQVNSSLINTTKSFAYAGQYHYAVPESSTLQLPYKGNDEPSVATGDATKNPCRLTKKNAAFYLLPL